MKVRTVRRPARFPMTGSRSRAPVERLIEPLLTARELGALLGFAAGTIVDWYEEGKIPGFKIGGQLRFRLSEVVAWLEQHRGKAVPTALGRPESAGVDWCPALSESARTASLERHRPDSTRDLLGGHES
jgi:excisionase family DNA binding protein